MLVLDQAVRPENDLQLSYRIPNTTTQRLYLVEEVSIQVSDAHCAAGHDLVIILR